MKFSIKENKFTIVIVVGVILAVALIGAKAGSLNPPSSPASTFYTLSQIFNPLASGSYDSSGVAANANGSVLGILRYISANQFWASSSSDIYLRDNDWQVGIGTSTPTEKFTLVDGNILQTYSSSSATRTYQPSVVGAIDNNTNFTAPTSVFVSGRYAYVGNYDSTAGKKNFSVIDIGNPASPSFVGGIDDDVNLYRVKSIYVSGKYAYAVSYNSTAGIKNFSVINISNPSSLSVVGTIDDDINLYQATSVFVSGKYAYVGNNDSTAGKKNFSVVDISNPTSPEVVGGIDDDTRLKNPRSVFISGKYAYIANANADTATGTWDVTIIDISNPTAPTIVGGINDDVNLFRASSIFVSGNYAYVSNSAAGSGEVSKKRFAILDVSNPTAPRVVSTILDTSVLSASNSLFVSGKYAYIVNGSNDSTTDNFAIIDVSNPLAPRIVGALNDDTNLYFDAHSVFVSGKYAYVAVNSDESAGKADFAVIDIAGIDAPTANIGNISAGSINVSDRLIANQGYFNSGLNVGPGGILVGGRLSIDVASISNNSIAASASAEPVFSIKGNQFGFQSGDVLDVQVGSTSFNKPERFSGNFARFTLSGSDRVIIESSGAILASGAVQFGAGTIPSSVSYSRFGISATGHSNYISSANDLLISGNLEVDSSVSFAGNASISGTVLLPNLAGGPSADTVCFDSTNSNALIKCSSSIRYKENITPLLFNKNKLLSLNPISFTWKQGGAKGIGLVAEDVYKEIPDLTFLDDDGQVGGVRYNLLPVYLLSLTKEHEQRLNALDGRGYATMGTSILPQSQESILSSILSYFETAALKVKKLFADTIEVDDGIIIHDKTTGNPYCVTVDNGQLQAISGTCGGIAVPTPEIIP